MVSEGNEFEFSSGFWFGHAVRLLTAAVIRPHDVEGVIASFSVVTDEVVSDADVSHEFRRYVVVY